MIQKVNLLDWQDNGQETIAEIDVKPDRIDVSFGTGAHVWLEYQDGRIRVHCYRPEKDEPVNVEIRSSGIEVDTHDYGPLPEGD